MTNILSNMLWLDRTKLPDEELIRLIRKFTIIGNMPYLGGETPVAKLYSHTKQYLGIPRTSASEYAHVDNTVNRGASPAWPDMEFPNGGDWREGQHDAFTAMCDYFDAGNLGGRFEAKCGMGKTVLALAVAQYLNVKTCVLVHKTDLADRWHEDAALFFPGITLGRIQGDTWAYKGAQLTTCMAQTLWSRRGKYPDKFGSEFDMIIIDEGHRFAAETFAHVLKIFGARYRLGVSATWRRNDGLDAVWEHQVGPIIAKGVGATLTGHYAFVRPPIYGLRLNPKMPRARVLNAIAKCTSYVSWLSGEVQKAALRGRTVLVISDRINLLSELNKLITAEFYRCGVQKTVGMYVGAINGKSTPKPVLTRALKADIILASYGMMSEGTSVPELDTLFIATPRSDVEQVVGRIQRIQHGKKQLLIVDPLLEGHPTFNSSAVQRQRVYKKLGFSPQVPT